MPLNNEPTPTPDEAPLSQASVDTPLVDEGGSVDPAIDGPSTSVNLESEEELFRALVARSRRDPAKLRFKTKDEEDTLVNMIIRDVEDNAAGNRQYVRNIAELWANWRGTTNPKNFPFDGCSNVRQPLTSVHVETFLARIIKALLGGTFVAKMSYLDKRNDSIELESTDQWFKYELKEVVKLYPHCVDMLRNVLITGIDINIPHYSHETRYLHSEREYDISAETSEPTVGGQSLPPVGNAPLATSEAGYPSAQASANGNGNGVAPPASPEPAQPPADDNHLAGSTLTELIDSALQKILNEQNDWGIDEPLAVTGGRLGDFKLNDDGRIVFSLGEDNRSLKADIWKNETIFDGVSIAQVQLEDLACPNTHGTIDELPFFAVRCWYTPQRYLQAIKDKFFLDLGDEENRRIIGMADQKIGEDLDQPITDLQDNEEGTDSRGTSFSDPKNQFIEVYRWEGWWAWGTESNDEQIDRLLQSATQVAVWVAVQSRRIIKIERLEDLNKDGKRSAVKFDFIKEPGRFFSMGLAEWLRHLQTVGDAIWNQRLDAGLLFNVPFGFYKPTAGMAKGAQPISIEPGKFFPVADPTGINMPRSNWQPAFSFAEESLVREYAAEQAGLSGGATGKALSKRQSASEYVGIAQAIDLRTELFVELLLLSLRELLFRILGLYQQFGPEKRIFRVAGEDGVKFVKQFEKTRLQGKLVLDMAGSVAQINEQTQRQVALDMLQIITEPIWSQMGVVGPDTYYSAIKKLAELMHYNDVPLHKPKLPPMSDTPQVEEHQMFAGQKPVGPTLGEDTHEHMAHHTRLAADARIMEGWSPESRELLAAHMRETMKTTESQQVVAQQQSILAAQLAQTMGEKGIRPGMSGQQSPNANTGPGTQAEGVATAGPGQSGASAAPAAAQ